MKTRFLLIALGLMILLGIGSTAVLSAPPADGTLPTPIMRDCYQFVWINGELVPMWMNCDLAFGRCEITVRGRTLVLPCPEVR